MLLLVACGGDVPEGPLEHEAEIEAIRRCDAAYKAALLDGDGETAFQKLAQDSGMSEDELLLGAISTLAGTRPGDEVWQPVSR